MQPLPDSALREEAVKDGDVEQLSVATAVPAAGKEDGLQLRVEEAGQEVNVGALVSTV